MRISPIQHKFYTKNQYNLNHKGNKGKVVGTLAGGALGAAIVGLGSVALGPLGIFMGATLIASGAGSGAIGGMFYDEVKESEKSKNNKK